MLLKRVPLTFYSFSSPMHPTPSGTLCSYVYVSSNPRNTVIAQLFVELMVLNTYTMYFVLGHLNSLKSLMKKPKVGVRGILADNLQEPKILSVFGKKKLGLWKDTTALTLFFSHDLEFK